MDLFVGLDASVRMTSLCVIDVNGKVLKEAKVESEPQALASLLGALTGQCRRVGIEAGAFSQRLYMAWPKLGIPPYASRRGTRRPHCRRRSTKRIGTTRVASHR